MTEPDIGDALYKDLLGLIDDLKFLDLEKESPGGRLLRRIVLAVSEYENS